MIYQKLLFFFFLKNNLFHPEMILRPLFCLIVQNKSRGFLIYIQLLETNEINL